MSKWMTNSMSVLRDRRLNHIILPGTHDSGAYCINWDVNPQLNNVYQLIYRLAQWVPWIRNITESWTLTQEFSIYKQLSMGIRYFDFRIIYLNDIFYLAHTFVCEPLQKVLDDIQNFLQESPNEVFIIQFSSEYENRDTMTAVRNNQVLDLLHNQLKELLIPKPLNEMFPTFGDILDTPGRIILYYSGEHYYRQFVWNINNLYDGWTTTTEIKEKLRYLNDELCNMQRTARNVNELEFTLTPDKSDLVKDVVKRLMLPLLPHKGLKKLGHEMQATLPWFVSTNGRNMLKITTITTDFPTEKFVEYVIHMNYF